MPWTGKQFRHQAALLAAALATGAMLTACLALPKPAAPASIPGHPAWLSAKPFGSWKNNGYIVFNNEWNTSAAGPQKIWANSFQHWGVESTQPDSTSVKTYPCVQRDYGSVPLSSVARLTSTFIQSMPAAGPFDAEAAYDIWLDHYKFEVMIWVDNHGQTPAGGVISSVRIQGRQFAVWRGSSTMYSFVLTGKQESSGAVDLRSFLAWLEQHGYLHGSDTMAQVNFGWEIASTGGLPLAFTVRGYSLSARLTG